MPPSATEPSTTAPAVAIRGITKTYATGFQALKPIDLQTATQQEHDEELSRSASRRGALWGAAAAVVVALLSELGRQVL